MNSSQDPHPSLQVCACFHAPTKKKNQKTQPLMFNKETEKTLSFTVLLHMLTGILSQLPLTILLIILVQWRN